METISLCMIVKDEEKVLDTCLNSIHDLVDEIIIVDTGSTDKTKEIAQKYTDKIYDFKWVDDFAKARNYSFSKATKDYIMWLDADDYLPEEEKPKFKKLKKSLNDTVDMYTMIYIYSRDKNGMPTYVQRKYRLLKRENNYQWESPIHEFIKPKGKIVTTDITIIHNKIHVNDPNRNLRIFEKMIKENHKFTIREQYCYADALYRNRNYQKAIELFEEFVAKTLTNYNQNKHYLYLALIELADCYKFTNNPRKEINTLLLILKNQIPTVNLLYKIGDFFRRQKQYKMGVYWLNLAVNSSEVSDNQQYEKYLSYISLGICYYYLKDYEKAYNTNEKAGKISPNSQTYINNKKIYQQFLKNNQ